MILPSSTPVTAVHHTSCENMRVRGDAFDNFGAHVSSVHAVLRAQAGRHEVASGHGTETA